MRRIDQVFRKNENFVFRQIDDETILVPIKNNVGDMGAIYNLNGVGAYVGLIWMVGIRCAILKIGLPKNLRFPRKTLKGI